MKTKLNIFFSLLVAVVALGFNSCKEDPYKYEIAKGQPEVLYVRMPDAAAADSLIDGAYMGNFVVLVGNNLKSTVAVRFNDQDAYLNTSLITEHTLFVQVPSGIPVDVQDKIFLTGENGTVIEYPFMVLVPGPMISGMTNEMAGPGMKATIFGDYFLDTEVDPFTLTLPDGTVLTKDDVELSKMAITFTVPANYGGDMGTLNVHTKYGEVASSFLFHDTRNVILDFDAEAPHDHGGYDAGMGWRGSISRIDHPEIVGYDGDFLCLGGAMDENGGWADDPFEFDAWYADGSYDFTTLPNMAAMLAQYELSELIMKFEVYVPKTSPWSAGTLRMIWMGEENSNGGHHHSGPHGLYCPWAATGSFFTEDWVTVTMPLKDFVYDENGATAATELSKADLKGLTIFVWNGAKGTACEPKIALDNIRIVPN